MIDIENAVGRQVCFKYPKKNLFLQQDSFFLTIKKWRARVYPLIPIPHLNHLKKTFAIYICFALATKIVLYYYLTNL